MHKVMITGGGKIGSLIACLLAESGDYQVTMVDLAFTGSDVSRLLEAMPHITTLTLDVTNEETLLTAIKKYEITAVISCLPFFLNLHVARAAKAAYAHYFDLTEDTAVTEAIKNLAKGAKTAFVPQCGLAPGFVSIVANSVLQEFDKCHHAKLRVGALPQRASNALLYSLTWSTDGVINEYGNKCFGIEHGKTVTLQPLEDLETLTIDGCDYEAFNTSGGLGSLSDLYQGKIKSLNYKTIRYPGHCEKMKFLMNDLKLNEDRNTLKQILERSIPKTYQDVVIIYVSVEGIKHGELREKSYMRKAYPIKINELEWSAIQISTASGASAIVDLVLSMREEYQGFLLQENFKLPDVLKNRFGQYFA